jgi:rhodanese-related sulfurtransferase
MSVSFLQPIQVKALLLDPQRRDKILILDVRDDDFDGGHIRANNFLNLPSYTLSTGDAIDEFIKNKLPSTVDTVVVHCYLSQQRGPTAARRIHERLLQLERAGNPEICVMAHGWRRWQREFGDDPELCVYPES